MIMKARTLPSRKLFRILLAVALVATLVPLAALSSMRDADAATLWKTDVNTDTRIVSGGIVLDDDLCARTPVFNVPVSTSTIQQSPNNEQFQGPNDTIYRYSYALSLRASDASKGNTLGTTITAKWTNAGFDANGDRIDLVITWLPDSKWYSSVNRSSIVLLDRYSKNTWNTAGINLYCNPLSNGKLSCEQHIRYNFYKAGTSTPAVGTFLTRFTDLDQPGWDKTYDDDWVERIEFITGHDQAMFTSTGNILKIGKNRNGEANTDYRATKKMDGSSLDSGVVTNLSNGAEFWFFDSRGGTDILDQFNAHRLTMSSGSHGSVSANGKTGTAIIGWRGNRTVSITPDTGYKVSNVVVNGSSEGAKTTRTFSNVTSDQSISATFAPINYQIRFNANGGSGSMTDQAMTYDQSTNLKSNAFSRTGHTFKGWNTAPDGSGTAYSNEQIVTNLTATDGSVITLYAQWEANNMNVMFTDGLSTTLSQGTVKYGQGATAPSEPTRVGYTFNGWDKDYSRIVEDTIINAKWRANAYSVGFNANTGAGSMADQPFLYDQAQALSGNVFTKTGYTFTGWNASPSGSSTPYTDKQTVSNLTAEDGGKVTLYAQWKANDYRIVYNANSGEGSMDDQTLTYDTVANLNDNLFTKSGYRFAGWNTKADGTGKTYHNKQAVLNLVAEDGAEVTLYAQWQPAHYSVVFFGNGGTDSNGGVMSAYQKMIFDECQELAKNIFEREGYTWQSWNSDSKGNGTTYTNEQVVKNLSDVAGAVIPLYSQWAVNKYSVSFNANGGEGTMDDQSFLYDHAKALTKNSFNKVGYTFKGWSIEPTGAVAYEDAQTVLNLTSTDGDKVTLYAVWEEDPDLRIAYVAHDPSQLSVSNATEELAPATGSVKGSTATPKAGYKFKEWKTAKGDTVSTSATFKPKRGSDGLWHAETYFAYASPIVYKIAYDGNGASGEMAKTNATYDEPVALTKNAFKHEGWRFLGWNTEPDGSGTSYANKQSVVNLTSADGATVTLYAQWEQKSFNVVFTDGQGNSLSSQTVDYGQGATAPEEPTREGYTFTGWDKAYDKITSDTTVNAKWRINSYTIAYDANGGEGTMSDQTVKFDEKAKLLSNNFDREGHVFTGWNTKADGTGTAYKNEQEVSNLTSTDGERITLYAQWKIEQFGVTFEDGMGGTIDKQEVDYGHDATAPADPEREGYKFQGWDGEYTNVIKDVTIKASWTTPDKTESQAVPAQAEKQAPEGGDYAKTGSNTLGWILFAGAFMTLAISVLWADRKRR
jgi:uncharacterized repeat protein (TIGR02543 family)